jgi:flavodoxin
MKQYELPIKNTDFDMQQYDSIIVGTPTWAGKPSPFVLSFIKKAENIKGKKVAVFGTGMTPINKREQFKEIINTNLKNAGISPVEDYLLINFKRHQIADGQQNIDKFVNTVLKS